MIQKREEMMFMRIYDVKVNIYEAKSIILESKPCHSYPIDYCVGFGVGGVG